MSKVDIDARLAAAEAEVTGESHELTIRGEMFVLPAELDALGIAHACRFQGLEQTSRLVEALFGEEQYHRLLAMKLGDVALGVVVQESAALYGMTMGESVASGKSSRNGSRSSRPTSKGSTG